jgi:hypothetical protein
MSARRPIDLAKSSPRRRGFSSKPGISQPSADEKCQDCGTFYVKPGQRGLAGFQNYDGSISAFRCGRSNSCPGCAWRAALVNSLMLRIDAELAHAGGRPPTVAITTTTRRPDFSLDELNAASQALWRQLRREAAREGRPKPEYCGFLEWQTGKGRRSGGHRRPHMHYLTKDLDADAAASLDLRLSELWRHYTGDAWVVECKPLRTAAGAIQYLSLHNNKKEQAPPPGLRHVRRLRASKGYYELPGWKLRKLAEELATEKRLKKLVDVICTDGLSGVQEIEIDREFSVALSDALHDMARRPSELQLHLDRSLDETDMKHERDELARRMLGQLQKRRQKWPSQVVSVYARETVDPTSGELRIELAPRGPIRGRPHTKTFRAAA